MKQLPGEIRDRLTRHSEFQHSISRRDVGEAVEAEESDEDGRPGTPGYFPSPGEEESDSKQEPDESADKEGKGIQIDLEA